MLVTLVNRKQLDMASFPEVLWRQSALAFLEPYEVLGENNCLFAKNEFWGTLCRENMTNIVECVNPR